MSEFVAAAAGETEAQWRQFLSYLFRQASPGVALSGVLDGLGVTQTPTASGSVLIDPGCGVVQPSLLGGALPLLNNAKKTLDVFGSNPVGSLPRNDLVVFDAATASIRALVGTPNAAPADPTVPSTALRLARLRHAANATSIPQSKIDSLLTPTDLRMETFLPVTTGATPQTGWSISLLDGEYNKNWVEVGLQVVRTGAALVATGPSNPLPGNLTDISCAILPASLRPKRFITAAWRSTNCGGELRIDTTGLVTLVSAHTGGVVANGDLVITTASYRRAEA